VAQGVDERPGQPPLVHRAARGNDGLRAEVGGKDGKRDEAHAEPPACQDVIGLARHAAGHDSANCELGQHYPENANQYHVPGFPSATWAAFGWFACTARGCNLAARGAGPLEGPLADPPAHPWLAAPSLAAPCLAAPCLAAPCMNERYGD